MVMPRYIGLTSWIPDLLKDHYSHDPWQPSPKYTPQHDAHFSTTSCLRVGGYPLPPFPQVPKTLSLGPAGRQGAIVLYFVGKLIHQSSRVSEGQETNNFQGSTPDCFICNSVAQLGLARICTLTKLWGTWEKIPLRNIETWMTPWNKKRLPFCHEGYKDY